MEYQEWILFMNVWKHSKEAFMAKKWRKQKKQSKTATHDEIFDSFSKPIITKLKRKTSHNTEDDEELVLCQYTSVLKGEGTSTILLRKADALLAQKEGVVIIIEE